MRRSQSKRLQKSRRGRSFRNMLSFWTKAPTPETDWIQDCFRRGVFIRLTRWSSLELARAKRILSRSNDTLQVTSLTLSKNFFEKDMFRALMHLLADRSELQTLRLSVSTVQDVEAVIDAFGQFQGTNPLRHSL